MRLREILKEGPVERIKFVLDRFGPKLEQAYSSVESGKPMKAVNIVKKLTDADPTISKIYLNWIANQYSKGTFRMEDVPYLHDMLVKFEKRKATFDVKDRDINTYKQGAPKENGEPDDTGLSKFYQKINSSEAEAPESSGFDEKDRAFFAKKHATLLHQDPDTTVVVPHTDDAAKHFGRNTSWCTNRGAFQSYHKPNDTEGQLYIVNHKGKLHQIHFGTKQFMDKNDSEIKPSDRETITKLPAFQKIKNHYLNG